MYKICFIYLLHLREGKVLVESNMTGICSPIVLTGSHQFQAHILVLRLRGVPSRKVISFVLFYIISVCQTNFST